MNDQPIGVTGTGGWEPRKMFMSSQGVGILFGVSGLLNEQLGPTLDCLISLAPYAAHAALWHGSNPLPVLRGCILFLYCSFLLWVFVFLLASQVKWSLL